MAGDVADGVTGVTVLGVTNEAPALVDRFTDGVAGSGSSRDYSPGLHGSADSGAAG